MYPNAYTNIDMYSRAHIHISYVCTYIYTYICIYIYKKFTHKRIYSHILYTHIFMQIHIHLHPYMYIYVWICIHTHIYMYTFLRAYVYTHICFRISHIYTYTYMSTYINKYIHIMRVYHQFCDARICVHVFT